jgi:hypothetical protein
VTTTLRKHLRKDGRLLSRVQDGLGAMSKAHKNDLLDAKAGPLFDDSIDVDEAFREQFPNANRWDYLLGHRRSEKVVALEPHSASNKEIRVVIEKKKQAQQQLRGELAQGRSVARWYWVASGKVDFLPYEKATLTLSQNGITFVGRRLMLRDLPS